MRHTYNISSLKDKKGLTYLAALNNHRLKNPLGEEDDYPY